MTDERPRPQYGEYATPEEVEAIRGTPPPPHPDELQPLAPPPQAHQRVSPPNVSSPVPGTAFPAQRTHAWDAFVTVALLVIGVWNTVQSVPGFLDFHALLTSATNSGLLSGIKIPDDLSVQGVALAVVDVALLLIAVVGAVLRIRRGRIAFWIPLTAGVLAFLVTVVVITSIVLSDPANVTLLQNRS